MVRYHPNSSQATAERTATVADRRLNSVRCEFEHGRTIVVFVRPFAASRSSVWQLLTSPNELVKWSPHTADRDLSEMGKATFTWLGTEQDVDAVIPGSESAGVVLVADPPRLLEHSWATDVLAWQLSDAGDGSGRSDASDTSSASSASDASGASDASEASTVLTLRHTLADERMASAVAAGWHLCFEVADSVLAGHPIPPMRGPSAMQHGWADLNRRYAKALGVPPTKIG